MSVSLPSDSLESYNQAVAKSWRGEWEAAESQFLEVLAQLPESAPAYDIRRQVHSGLSQLNEGLRRWAEAAAVRGQELALVRKVSGPRHPHVATCLEHLGWLAWRQGRAEA
ncbi:MAG TPA: tetratricopeptide repeat protein, partial [Candidatus Xenobia bacterium]